MADLGLGAIVRVDPPAGPVFKTAPPSAPSVSVVPVAGPAGPPGAAQIPPLIDCGGPTNSNGA